MVKCWDFAGLVGAGRTETMRAIFGANPIDGGQVYVHGKEVKIKSPSQAIKAGIATRRRIVRTGTGTAEAIKIT